MFEATVEAAEVVSHKDSSSVDQEDNDSRGEARFEPYSLG